MKVYHITYPINRQSILEFGLLPKESEKYYYLHYGTRIFFFIPKTKTDILVAFYHTKDEDMDLFEIDIDMDKLNKDDKSEADNHFWIDFPIKAKLFKKNINMWDISLMDFL
jgi:hypothetical protein